MDLDGLGDCSSVKAVVNGAPSNMSGRYVRHIKNESLSTLHNHKINFNFIMTFKNESTEYMLDWLSICNPKANLYAIIIYASLDSSSRKLFAYISGRGSVDSASM